MNWDAYLIMGVNQHNPEDGYRLVAVKAESSAKAIELFQNEFLDFDVATYPSLTQMRESCQMLESVMRGETLSDQQMENLNAVIFQD